MDNLADVLQLVDRFDFNIDDYKSGQYKEERVRVEFVNPLFEALGWDVTNTRGHAEQYKDVVHEASVRVGGDGGEGRLKAPDYSFRIAGRPKFFVEVKKPSVNIYDDIHPAYQLRRYAWSADMPLSILTDFEEIAIYDCRFEPEKGDSASKARVAYFRYDELEENWEWFSGLFSKDSILRGAFDKYAEDESKRGTESVNSAFLKEIERWRESFARDIAENNDDIGERDLNAAVQKLIDRIIFLRIAEDRGLEAYGDLKTVADRDDRLYNALLDRFQQADVRYNAGLFHFTDDDRHGDPDTIATDLDVSDDVLRPVISGLYYPDSPYVFDQIPADILGQVYEQFLGRVISIDESGSSRTAVVDEKPEVKKKGGVFYTPTFVVDDIVEGTLQPLLEAREAGEPESLGTVPDLKIVDPACGSGSFLIGAFDYMLNWYRQQYTATPEAVEFWSENRTKAGKVAEKHPYHQPARIYRLDDDSDWRLTVDEKKRILKAHLYGVDIDRQAVEVTKLSLLLKLLEGESQATLEVGQMRDAFERVLPDLSENIHCGNSLVAPDFYEGSSMDMFSDAEHYRINVFDWQSEFPNVFESGGFDAVIGNPPYIRKQTLSQVAPEETAYVKERYRSARKWNFDIYVAFVEKGLDVLNDEGRLGYILPHKFFNARYGEELRCLISEGNHLRDIIHFGDEQVFGNASTYTCLMYLGKREASEFRFVEAPDLPEWKIGNPRREGMVEARHATCANWNFVIGPDSGVYDHLSAFRTTLEDATDRIFQGLKTSRDDVYIVEQSSTQGGLVDVYSPELDDIVVVEEDLFHPLIKGGDAQAYDIQQTNRLILFPYEPRPDGEMGLIPFNEIENRYAETAAYLRSCKTVLEGRESGRMEGSGWHAYVYPKALDVMSNPKIFIPDLAPESSYAWDESGVCFFTGGTAGGYGIVPANGYPTTYLLGVLNSQLLFWYLTKISTTMRGGWYSFVSKFISDLPIIPFAETGTAERTLQDSISARAERLHDLVPKHRTETNSQRKELLSRQVETLRRKVDEDVYELYGLNSNDIQRVRQALKEQGDLP